MQLNLLHNLHLNSKYSENGTNDSNFAKFGNFTSDGSSFSITSSDNSISFYNVDEDIKDTHSQLYNGTNDLIPSEINPLLTLKVKDDIRDFCWFPNFNKNDPDSCCFLIASRNKPIILYDSLTGAEHFTYKPINAVCEIAESYCIDFHPLGKYFLSGSLSCVYVFDIQSPGEHIELRRLSTKKSTGQKGIISTISHNNFGSGNTYACGTYNGSVSIYDHNLSRTVSLTGDFLDPEFPLNPITHIKWIDETKIIVGCRNDYYLRLYDTRGDLSSPLQRFYRPVNNNQKITFDYKDNLLFSGTCKGDLLVYDLQGTVVHSENLSGLPIPVCTFNPKFPHVLICSGTRNFEDHSLDSPKGDSEPSSSTNSVPFNRVYSCKI